MYLPLPPEGGVVLPPAAGALMQFSKNRTVNRVGEALMNPLVAGILAPVAGGHVGFRIGEATYKPLGAQDVVARNTHPLLLPPKPVKAKVKLDVKER